MFTEMNWKKKFKSKIFVFFLIIYTRNDKLRMVFLNGLLLPDKSAQITLNSVTMNWKFIKVKLSWQKAHDHRSYRTSTREFSFSLSALPATLASKWSSIMSHVLSTREISNISHYESFSETFYSVTLTMSHHEGGPSCGSRYSQVEFFQQRFMAAS